MTRGSVGLLSLPLLALACDGRELTVFSVSSGGAAGMAVSPGLGGTEGGAGAAGSVNASGAGTGAGGSGGTLIADGGSDGSSMAGASGTSPKPCADESDCGPGWICEKPGCDAATGFCAQWPPFCSPDPAPVCGCDGITYWNDCIRLNSPSHAQLAASEPCRATACTCEKGSDCGVPYASCSHLMAPGEICGHSMGACWVLPPTCGASRDFKRWRECKPPDAGPPGPCATTCEAIESERPYAGLHRGDSCL